MSLFFFFYIFSQWCDIIFSLTYFKGLNINIFNYDTSVKNNRYRISYNRAYRSWCRYRYSFRSSNIRSCKESIFKRTTFFLRNTRFCILRSNGFVCFNDGFFAFVRGLAIARFSPKRGTNLFMPLGIFVAFYRLRGRFYFFIKWGN